MPRPWASSQVAQDVGELCLGWHTDLGLQVDRAAAFGVLWGAERSVLRKQPQSTPIASTAHHPTPSPAVQFLESKLLEKIMCNNVYLMRTVVPN